MQSNTSHPQFTRPSRNAAEQLHPPVIRWHLPAPRLQGVRFESPVAKIRTSNSPLQPSRPT